MVCPNVVITEIKAQKRNTDRAMDFKYKGKGQLNKGLFILRNRKHRALAIQIYFRIMVFKYLGRWLFVLMTGIILFFCWWNFRTHLRTSSDPFLLLPERVQWVWVIQNWNEVVQMNEENKELPFLKAHRSDVEIWKEWAASYPDIQLLLNQNCILWASKDSSMQEGFWCFGIPDNWSDARVDQLCKQVPHLLRKGEGVIWSVDGQYLDAESSVNEAELDLWRADYQTIDHASPIAVLGVNALCRFALENRNGDWWGYISAKDNLLGNVPLDTLMELKKGDWCSAAYIKNLEDHSLDSALMARSSSFAMDTACQCDAWEIMYEWQPLLASIHFSVNQGVVFHERFEKNPIRSFRKLFSDTTSALLKVRNKEFLRGTIYPDLNVEWKWAVKKQQSFFVSSDSLALISFQKDTATFKDLRFEHSFPNHPVVLGYHRNAGSSDLMPINWTLIKGQTLMSVQIYASGEHRWVVQLNHLK